VVAAAVVAGVLVVTHLPGAQPHSASRPHHTTPTAQAAALPGPARPDGVTGPVLPLSGQLRLPLTGPQPSWYWPATGRRERIAGLPLQPSGYLFTQVEGGWVVQPAGAVHPGPPSKPGCRSCATPPAPAYYLAATGPAANDPATEVGTANRVAAGATPATIWLTSYAPGADPATAAGQAREVSTEGTALRPPVRLPAGYVIAQGTVRGLLLGPASPRPGRDPYRLWDPAGARQGRAFGALMAASATALAWVPACAQSCRLHVLSLASGREITAGLPPGSSVANAAFSPDGRRLALQLSSGGDDGDLAMQLDSFSVQTRRLSVIPGTWVSSDALVGFGWPAGDDLVAELSFTTKVQVVAWKPGAARIAVATIGSGPASRDLVTG
jgi:hypothetical protein